MVVNGRAVRFLAAKLRAKIGIFPSVLVALDHHAPDRGISFGPDDFGSDFVGAFDHVLRNLYPVDMPKPPA